MIKLCDQCNTNHFPARDFTFNAKGQVMTKFLCQRCIDQMKDENKRFPEKLAEKVIASQCIKASWWQKFKFWLKN